MIDSANAAYDKGLATGYTDSQFDAFCTQLRHMDPGNVRLRSMRKLAAGNGRGTGKHTSFVGSVANASTLVPGNDVAGFERWANNIDHRGYGYVAQHKLDGLSVTLYYEDGMLIRGLTRGDGRTGEDITSNIVGMTGVPWRLGADVTVAIRGEVYLSYANWRLVDPQEASNPRNLAVGIAMRLDGNDSEYLAFSAVDVVPADVHAFICDTEEDVYDWLKDHGFHPVETQVCKTPAQVVAFYEQVRKERANLPYMVDGIVAKMNHLHARRLLGDVSDCPRGWLALKYPAEIVETTVRAVDWSVGHTGKLTPVARLAPVKVGGVRVANATLCNMDEIRRLKIGVGTRVGVFRAGDVIPKLTTVDAASNEKIPLVESPGCCPVCAGVVQTRDNSDGGATVDLYCTNDNCPAKTEARVMNWIAKNDIKGIGSELLKALMLPVNNAHGPMVTGIFDLYSLNMRGKMLADLVVGGRRLGDSKAKQVIEEIDKTRSMGVCQFLGSLGIKHLGRRRARLICEAYAKLPASQQKARLAEDPLDWLDTALVDNADKLGIPGTAIVIQRDLQSRQEEITLLKTAIICTPETFDSDKPASSGKLGGKSFCLTGKMSRERSAIAADIVAAGGVVKDDVAKGLNYLVQADPSSQSSKSKKANKLSIPVIDEASLIKMMA